MARVPFRATTMPWDLLAAMRPASYSDKRFKQS
jgi:hypothetical protein